MDDIIATDTHYHIERRGRFIIAELLGQHGILSTSAWGGGQREDVRYIVNHQSCEGSGHDARAAVFHQLSERQYHQQVCAELTLEPEAVALMGTAANMSYAATASEEYAELRVRAVVTAGVEGNAGRAGDPTRWHEGEDGWSKVDPNAGTINIILLINWPLTPAALARTAITMTESKTAVLQELAVSSRYSEHLATGTGTDQYCVAAPIDESKRPKSNAGHHAKLGELIGRTVLRAMREALRWQNGLEPSYTRGLAHALKRFGFTEERCLAALEKRLAGDLYNLLEKNGKAVFYEPQVAAAAYACSAIWDRVQYGTLSSALARTVLRQQAATLASCLAAKPDSWPECWQALAFDESEPLTMIYDALALGWELKWN